MDLCAYTQRGKRTFMIAYVDTGASNQPAHLHLHRLILASYTCQYSVVLKIYILLETQNSMPRWEDTSLF